MGIKSKHLLGWARDRRVRHNGRSSRWGSKGNGGRVGRLIMVFWYLLSTYFALLRRKVRTHYLAWRWSFYGLSLVSLFYLLSISSHWSICLLFKTAAGAIVAICPALPWEFAALQLSCQIVDDVRTSLRKYVVDDYGCEVRARSVCCCMHLVY